jgi:microcompartment protein CcmK/EutM
MDLAVVIGSVVATKKEPSFEGAKLAIVQPVDEDLTPQGSPFIALDPESRCGNGQIVYWVGGGDACTLGVWGTNPADAAIVGLVDEGAIHMRPDLKSVPGGLTQFLKTKLDEEA